MRKSSFRTRLLYIALIAAVLFASFTFISGRGNVSADEEAVIIVRNPQEYCWPEGSDAFYPGEATDAYGRPAEDIKWYIVYEGVTYDANCPKGNEPWYRYTDPEREAGVGVSENGLSIAGIKKEFDGAEVFYRAYDGGSVAESTHATVRVGNSDMYYAPSIEVPAYVLAEQYDDVWLTCNAESRSGNLSPYGEDFLGYCWYVTSTGKLEDIVAVNRGSETGREMMLDTSETGVFYYICGVIDGEDTKYVNFSYSSPIKVEIYGQPSVSEIKIVKKPKKMTYKLGESPDLTGLQVQYYLDGEPDVIIGGDFLDCEPAVFERAGQQLVMISDQGFSDYYFVNVTADASYVQPSVSVPEESAVRTGKNFRFSCDVSIPENAGYNEENITRNWYEIVPGAGNSLIDCSDSGYLYDVSSDEAGNRYFMCRVDIEYNGTVYSIFSNIGHVEFYAPYPSVTYSESEIELEQGSEITVTASVKFRRETDRGQLTYQWYRGANNIPGTFSAIPGADSDTIKIIAAEPSGKEYYYCEVINRPFSDDTGTEPEGTEYSSVSDSPEIIRVEFSPAATPVPSEPPTASPEPTAVPAVTEVPSTATPEVTESVPTQTPVPSETASAPSETPSEKPSGTPSETGTPSTDSEQNGGKGFDPLYIILPLAGALLCGGIYTAIIYVKNRKQK